MTDDEQIDQMMYEAEMEQRKEDRMNEARNLTWYVTARWQARRADGLTTRRYRTKHEMKAEIRRIAFGEPVPTKATKA
jgi:hypothetical protein